VALLLQLKKTSLPNLSDMVGKEVRTNNESLIACNAIGQFFRPVQRHRHRRHFAHRRAQSPRIVPLRSRFRRLAAHVFAFCGRAEFQGSFVQDDLGSAQSPETILAIPSGKRLGQKFVGHAVYANSGQHGDLHPVLVGRYANGRGWQEKPTAFIPRAIELARKFEVILKGKAVAFGLTPLMGIPGTAHILGGAVMGESTENGVIDRDNRVFGYENMLVCDGSMISANPGVNPALSITAISERAMERNFGERMM
jgi:cholesterol oxidase